MFVGGVVCVGVTGVFVGVTGVLVGVSGVSVGVTGVAVGVSGVALGEGDALGKGESVVVTVLAWVMVASGVPSFVHVTETGSTGSLLNTLMVTVPSGPAKGSIHLADQTAANTSSEGVISGPSGSDLSHAGGCVVTEAFSMGPLKVTWRSLAGNPLSFVNGKSSDTASGLTGVLFACAPRGSSGLSAHSASPTTIRGSATSKAGV